MARPLRIAAAAALLTATAAPAFIASAPATAKAPPSCTGKTKTGFWLNVAATNVRSSKGTITITIYPDSKRKFLARGGDLTVGRLKARAGTTRGCIFVPGKGVYAVAVYHDENGNTKFDRSGIGLPAEGYGFSNNPSTLAGLPAFRSVRLGVPKPGLTARINMKYP